MKIQRISDGRIFDLYSIDDRLRLRDEHGCRLVWSDPYDVVRSVEPPEYYLLVDACGNYEPLDMGKFRLHTSEVERVPMPTAIGQTKQNADIADISELSFEELCELAIHQDTPRDILERLSTSTYEYVRLLVAEHPNTPPHVLVQLANSDNYGIRGAVAARYETPHETVSQLARDDHDYVRAMAARNPLTPVEALERLAADGSDSVRLAVAAHWNTPRHILQRLAADPHPNVRELVSMRLAETRWA